MSQQLNAINQGQSSFNQQLTAYLTQITHYVKEKKIIIDASTIESLRYIVENKTNNKLGTYIGNVQRDAINQNFNELNNTVKQQQQPINQSFKKISKRLTSVENKIDTFGQQIEILFYLFVAVLLIVFVVNLPQWISAFSKHPIWSSIAVIACVIGGVYFWLKGSNDDDE
ncbi:hypothetical protein H5W18_10775 [Lactobacillus sp. Marseille-P7033]|nr:hypothetical protein [Lactobacillus sp. Marseille-P7033]NGC78955.1 hypothetical protein [Limosilactobacillus reuteri]